MQFPQKRRFSSVSFVEGQPVEGDAVGGKAGSHVANGDEAGGEAGAVGGGQERDVGSVARTQKDLGAGPGATHSHSVTPAIAGGAERACVAVGVGSGGIGGRRRPAV